MHNVNLSLLGYELYFCKEAKQAAQSRIEKLRQALIEIAEYTPITQEADVIMRQIATKAIAEDNKK